MTHYIPTDLDITNFDEITEALADTIDSDDRPCSSPPPIDLALHVSGVR